MSSDSIRNSANIPRSLTYKEGIWKRKVFYLCSFFASPVPLNGAPGNPEFEKQIQAAQTAFAAGKYPAAIDAFKKASKQLEGCARCFLGMGYSYLKIGDANATQKSAEKALSVATSDADRATAHDLKGQALFYIGERDRKSAQRGESEFREAARLAPTVAMFHLDLARSLMNQSKDDDAVPELKQCLGLNPSARWPSWPRGTWLILDVDTVNLRLISVSPACRAIKSL